MKKNVLFFVGITLLCATFVNAQTTYPPVTIAEDWNVPDEALRYYITSTFAFLDTKARGGNADGILQKNEAANYGPGGFGDPGKTVGLGVKDLTGMEAFVKIATLYMQNEKELTTIDVSNMPSVTRICAWNSGLTTVKINPNLVSLYVAGNNLSSIDLSAAAALRDLDLGRNNFTTFTLQKPTVTTFYINGQKEKLTLLDVTAATEIRELYAQGNALATIDLSQNVNLSAANLSDNQLTSLNLPNNTKFTVQLKLNNNKLTEFTVPASMTLTSLNIESNYLKKLDLSHVSKLSRLNVQNQGRPNEGNAGTLTYLNVATGHNVKDAVNTVGLLTLLADKNPNLTCIRVDASITDDEFFIAPPFGPSTVSNIDANGSLRGFPVMANDGWNKPDAASYNTFCKQAQIITWGENLGIVDGVITKNANDEDFVLSAIGGASNNPVSFTINNPKGITVARLKPDNVTVEILAAGTATITATQAGNNEYVDASVNITLNVTQGSSLWNLKNNTSFSLQANPVENDAHFSFNAASINAQINIIDLNGRTVATQTVAAGSTEVTVSVGHLPNGVYIARYTDYSGKQASLKLIK